MDIRQRIIAKIEKLLSELKLVGMISSFVLKTDLRAVDNEVAHRLLEIDALLSKCLEKLRRKPRCAEIRNVICELVKIKNTEQEDVKYHVPEPNIGRIEVAKFPVTDEEEVTGLPGHFPSFTSSENKLYLSDKNYNNTSYLCEFCGLMLLDLSNLKLHIFASHRKRVTFQYNDCTHSFPISKKIGRNFQLHPKRHMKVLTERRGKLLGKNDKGRDDDLKVNSKLDALNVGQNLSDSNPRKATSDKDFILQKAESNLKLDIESYSTQHFICSNEGCGKIFRLKKSLRTHERLKHSLDKIEYQCEFCNKLFSERGKLNRHTLSHSIGKFQCSQCDMKFHRKDHLRRHVITNHENIKSFSCKYCNKKFSMKFNRNEHEKNVHNRLGIQCDFCQEKCKNEATYKMHLKIHEGKPFSCALCTKTFIRRINYRNHLNRKHNGQSPFQMLFDSFVETCE